MPFLNPNRWLQHYPSEIDSTYDYPQKNLASLLLESSQKFPENIAIHFMGKELTYKELLQDVYRFSKALTELGLKKGDRVAIMLPNCPQAIIAYYGALLVGAIVVQVNPMYTERELEHQLQDSESIMIITLDLLSNKVAKVKAKTNLNEIIVTSIKDYLPFPQNMLYTLKLAFQAQDKLQRAKDIHFWKEMMTNAVDTIDLIHPLLMKHFL